MGLFVLLTQNEHGRQLNLFDNHCIERGYGIVEAVKNVEMQVI